MAEKLAKYISMDPGKDKQYGLTLRNRKEYWYIQNTKEAKSRLTDKEIEEMDNSEQYSTMLERIKEEEVAFDNFSQQQREVMAIKKKWTKQWPLHRKSLLREKK